MNQDYKLSSLIDNSTYLVHFSHQYGISRHNYDHRIKTKLKARCKYLLSKKIIFSHDVSQNEFNC